MSDRIKLTWHGHSCFKIEAKGHSAVIDPYTGVPGYPELFFRRGKSIPLTTMMITAGFGRCASKTSRGSLHLK